MLTAILLIVAPDVPPADALRFGMTREIVRANYEEARRHYRYLTEVWHEPDPCMWTVRQSRIKETWRKLDQAFDPTEAMPVRVTALNELRWIIGEDAYRCGRMFPAVPDYGHLLPALLKEK